MSKGRPRKPSAIRDLEGNRSRTAIPPDMPLTGLPECPDKLAGEAREHFTFVAAELSAIGVTKRLDSAALAVLASLWGAYWEAVADKDIDGMTKLVAKWSTLAGRFGLTPADRAKLVTNPQGKPDETEERFFQVIG